jgi:hypothetical protein
MRYLFGVLCVCALGTVPLVGCGETVRCEMDVCPCSEQGIRAATAAGGGPYTFDCDGATIVRTRAEILLRNDVILDGEGNLTIDGDNRHRVFRNFGAMVELRGLTVTGGSGGGARVVVDGVASHKTTGPWTVGGGILNEGTLSLTNCTVSGNTTDMGGGGIYNGATLTLANSTVSENIAGNGGGIYNNGTLTLTNSTVSGNTAWAGGGLGGGEGVNLYSTLTLINSTVSGNTARSGEGGGIWNAGTLALINTTVSGDIAFLGTLTSTSTLMDGACDERSRGAAASNGFNIESPGNTCGFDQQGDQANVTEAQLNLGELADNGGPTKTHALLPGSVAIDMIPADLCEVDEDQRGFPRDSTCDIGAFEVQP